MIRIAFLLFFILVLISVSSAEQEILILKVQVPVANVRSAPDPISPVIAQVKKDTLLESKTKIEDWYEVAVSNDRGETATGYISAGAVEVMIVNRKPVPARDMPPTPSKDGFAEKSYGGVVPKPYVNDLSGRLNEEDRNRVQKILSDADRTDHLFLIVLILRSFKKLNTPDDALESFTKNLFNETLRMIEGRIDIGLIVVNLEDSRVAVLFGKKHPAAFAIRLRTIISDILLPDIRAGNLGRALIQGCREILQEMKNSLKT